MGGARGLAGVLRHLMHGRGHLIHGGCHLIDIDLLLLDGLGRLLGGLSHLRGGAAQGLDAAGDLADDAVKLLHEQVEIVHQLAHLVLLLALQALAQIALPGGHLLERFDDTADVIGDGGADEEVEGSEHRRQDDRDQHTGEQCTFRA